MTPEELNEWLAVNVMKFDYTKDSYGLNNPHLVADWDAMYKWSPTTNIAQALECLEKFDEAKTGWYMEGDLRIYWCFIPVDKGRVLAELEGTLPKAISLAVARAAGAEL